MLQHLNQLICRASGIVSCLAIILLAACASPSAAPDGTIADTDLSTDVQRLDFGATEDTKTFTIKVPTPPAGAKGFGWNIRRSEAWLQLDAEDGSSTKTITARINRSRLPIGTLYDTLTILARRTGAALQSGTIATVTIPVSVQNPPKTTTSMSALYQQLVGGSLQLPPGLDSAASITAAFSLNAAGATVLSALGAFYQNKQFLVDAGVMSIKAGTFLRLDSVAMTKRSFTFTNPATSQPVSGTYYAPSSTAVPAELLRFDGTTFQRFNVYGSSTFVGYRDSVVSVVSPVLTSPASGGSASRSSGLALQWTASADVGDSVYAVVISAVDSTKLATSIPVPDANGTVTISSTQTTRLPAGSANVILVRYRTAIRITSGGEKRIILSLAQRSYTITLQ